MVGLPSFQVSLESESISAGELLKKLRMSKPPIIARVRRGKVLLDLRSIKEEEDRLLLDTVIRTLGNCYGSKNGGIN